MDRVTSLLPDFQDITCKLNEHPRDKVYAGLSRQHHACYHSFILATRKLKFFMFFLVVCMNV